jgi:integrase
MAVRKLRDTWWVDFRFSTIRYRKRSPDNSRQGALVYESTLRQTLARGDAIDRVADEAKKTETFEQFARKWFDSYVIPNNKFSEQRTKKYVLNAALIPFFGKLLVGEIGAYHIERYKAHELKNGITNKTLKNRLTVLNKCLCTAYEWLELGTNPPKIKWPKVSPARTDYLSPDECELLLSRAEGVLHEMLLTTLRTGMRQGELKGLQWSSIDWQNRIVAVRHSRCDYRKILGSTKSNRERYIPLDIDVYQMLHERKKDTGYVFLDADKAVFDNKRLNRRLAKLCKKAGLRKITWHVLRHTFASQLAMRGVPMPTVQALLGHAHITTTMRYTHVAPSSLRTAIDMLNPKTMLHAELGQPAVNQWLQVQKSEAAQQSMVPKNL